MRVHPILDWDYNDIWQFIKALDIKYCSLYDAGYTSIGGTNNTKPNELLRNPWQPTGYDPAYLLKDTLTERHGRPI